MKSYEIFFIIYMNDRDSFYEVKFFHSIKAKPPKAKEIANKIAKNTEYTIKKAMIGANAVVDGGVKNPELPNEILII